MIIIGLTGAPTSGKKIVAQHLVERHGFARVGFTDALIDMLKAGFGLTDDDFTYDGKTAVIPELGATPLELMQTFGFEQGRCSLGRDFWVGPWRQRLTRAGRKVVVDDIRWPNEAMAVRARRGVIWEVVRPNVSNLKNCADITPDRIMHNAGGIGLLRRRATESVIAHIASQQEAI